MDSLGAAEICATVDPHENPLHARSRMTAAVAASTNGELQAAVDGCSDGVLCQIRVTANIAITSALSITGKTVEISSGKADGSDAVLDGGGTTQLVNIGGTSTVSFVRIEFKNGYAVSEMVAK